MGDSVDELDTTAQQRVEPSFEELVTGSSSQARYGPPIFGGLTREPKPKYSRGQNRQ